MKWYLGAASLAMITEQDRRHWLMKTDASKEVQDTVTGDIFQGRIENVGSDIILETEKTAVKDYVVHKGTFSKENVSDVFNITRSVFSYIPMMNGLHFLRIKSINLDIEGTYHNYRLKLTNVKACYVPIAPDKTDPDQFVYKWYYTTDRPVLEAMDVNGQWTISQDIAFSEGVTNPVYYFPADEVLQPINAILTANDEVITDLVDNDDMIGMPLVWFVCKESDIGPKITLTNNQNENADSLLLSIGHNGNTSPYKCNLFTSTGISSESVPSGNIDDWKLVCKAVAGEEFDGTPGDSVKPVSRVLFVQSSGVPDDQRYVEFSDYEGNNKITLNLDAGWEYDETEHSYSVLMELFDTNLYGEETPLIPVFNVELDSSVPFDITSSDTGFAGVRLCSSDTVDQTQRYPHDIENLDGLPAWIRNRDDQNLSPQHVSIYAAHNTPFYDPEDQQTRQIAGLLMDPGVERTYDTQFHPGRYRITRVDIINGGSGYNFALPSSVVVHCYQDPVEHMAVTTLYSDSERTQPITPARNMLYETQLNRRFWYDSTHEEYMSCDLMWDHLYDVDGDNIGTKNRFWVTFPDGTISRTLFEVSEVDENGTVLSVNPLYPGEVGDDVKEMIYAYFNQKKNKFYATKSELIEIEPNSNKVYKDLRSGYVYMYSDVSKRYYKYDQLWSGTTFDEAYDPNELTGTSIQTVWLYSNEHSYNDIMQARNSQIAGTGSGLMDDTYPWWLFTYTSGTGLILSISLEYLQEEEAPYTSDDVPTEQLGRVYILSNDSETYINNATAKNPKPERTAARICDIPTSVMQLSNISGVAPTSVVDKEYVRSQASYTTKDQEYLYNSSKNRWVRPIDLGRNGVPIYNPDDPDNTNSNKFVFDSMDKLNLVDLRGHNDYRMTINLNRSVPPSDVEIDSISTPGTGYAVGDTGTIVVGGYSFTYIVNQVSATGQVLDVSMGSNDPSGAMINLANFSMPEGSSAGYTTPYGTAPLGNSQGRGLKLVFKINHYSSLTPKKGDIFPDIYALVSTKSGVWLCERINDNWVQSIKIAEADDSNSLIAEGSLSTKDSYLNSILPSYRVLPVSPEKAYAQAIRLNVFQSASALNIVDENTTPVYVPAVSGNGAIDTKTWVDINKIYCRGVKTLIAETRNDTSVIEAIKTTGDARFDCYIFWRWLEPENMNNRAFEYGIIHRSLDNLQSTDTISMLPANELEMDKYVHTNAQTTIMWNVPHVGPMVWMYDPNSDVHEKYYVNAHTRELYVVREKYKWEDIEIIGATGEASSRISLLDDTYSGYLKYNIYTNSPAYVYMPEGQTPIYKQPQFIKLMAAGPEGSISAIREHKPPKGSWRLIFPAITTTEAYTLRNITDGREFTPVKMQVLRGANITAASDVINDDGLPVNYKTILMDENTATGKIDMKAYNQESHTWMKI